MRAPPEDVSFQRFVFASGGLSMFGESFLNFFLCLWNLARLEEMRYILSLRNACFYRKCEMLAWTDVVYT